MIFLLLKFAYILLLSYVYGMAVSGLLSRWITGRRLGKFSFPLVCIAGLVTLDCLATYLSLALPMGTTANLIVLALGLLLMVVYRAALREASWLLQVRSAPVWAKVFFVLSAVFILYISSHQSLTYDEGLYYSQFIRWTQTYPVVPGLANLHDRFGFNSSWHVLAALFNEDWLTGQAVNQINGVLYLLVVLYLLGGLNEGATGRLSRFLKLGLLVLVNMPWVGVYNFIAPAADLVVFYLLCLLIVVWLEHLERGDSLLNGSDAALLWIVPAYLLTVKLSALPVLLLTAMLCWQAIQLRRYRSLTGLLSVSALVVAPWLVRNVILSGYLLYPFERLNLFAVDWKVPVAKVRETREAIEAFGYLRNKVPALEVHSRLDRLRFLFRYNIRPYDMLILLAVPLSPLVAWWRRRDLPGRWFGLFAFIWIGIAFWFIQAPDPRFGYGYLATLALLVLGLCVRGTVAARAGLFALALALAFEASTLPLYRHLKTNLLAEGTIVESPRETHWLLPQPYETPQVDMHQEPFLYYTPVHLDLCWGTDLPCADQVRTDIKMRGGSLRDGFADANAGANGFRTFTLPTGKGPASIEVADLNKDGFPDIAVANTDDSSVTIYLGDGHGRFTPAPESPFYCGEHPNDLLIADVNHDGNPDLCIANTEVGMLTVLLGNGRGQFPTARKFPVYARPHTHGIAFGDFDGDGNLDLATDSWGLNRVLLLFGDGHGNFGREDSIQVGLHPYQRLRAADLNHDGRSDIVTTNLDGDDVSVMLGQGNGVFRETRFPAGNMPFAVAIGDVNGDGHPDLAVCDAPTITADKRGSDGLFILLGDGTGRFTPLKGSPFPTGTSPSRVAIGDLDRDGINDIAVTNYNSGSITLYYMSKGGVKTIRTIATGNLPHGIAICDVNGDGLGDILVTNSSNNTLLVLINKP